MTISKTDDIRQALRDEEIKGQAYIELKGKIETFDPGIEDSREFYLGSILNWLVNMSHGEVDLLLPLISDKLNIGKSSVLKDLKTRQEVKSFKSNGKPNRSVYFEETIPWDASIDGSQLLDEISSFIRKFVDLNPSAATAVSAWAMATWLKDEVNFAPILAILSPTKRSGKTLLLDLINMIAFRSHRTSGVGITPAVVFRLNEEFGITLLIDEAEKLSGDTEVKDLIGLLNEGHRKGGRAYRCGGPNFEVQSFNAFGFRALAAIGRLWDTIMDRAIIIQMARKPPDTKIERFNAKLVMAEGKIISQKIARWVGDWRDQIPLAESCATRPVWLNDRACDNWSTLFAVGFVAGGNWEDRLLNAARELSKNEEEADRGEMLLKDVKAIFKEAGDPAYIQTKELIDRLNENEESPWADSRGGKGLSPQRLSVMLRRFGIKSSRKRVSENPNPIRGYWLEDFRDSFSRYFPVPPLEPAHPAQDSKNNKIEETTSGTEIDPQKRSGTEIEQQKQNGKEFCAGVPDQKGISGIEPLELGLEVEE